MSSESERHKSDRVGIACRTCRRRKVRCTGGHPCRNCSKLATECSYPPRQRRQRTKKNTTRVEDVVPVSEDDQGACNVQNPPSTSDRRSHLPVNAEYTTSLISSNPAARTTAGEQHAALSPSDPKPPEPGLPASLSQPCPTPRADPARRFSDVSPTGLSVSDGSTTINGQDQRGKQATCKERDVSAWMSACSDAGIAWVCEATGSRTYSKIVERFTRDIDRRPSTVGDLVLAIKGSEPTEALAWEYVNAFFENCWEARLGFIQREDFEAHLQAHYYEETSTRNDFAEIALRNIVFAAGYRSLLAKTTTVSYAAARNSAWQGYFSNALSVLGGLLLSPSRIVAVQALALMTCYVEGLENPEFQRVLCYNTVHLAVAQGLHRGSNHLTSSSSDEGLKKAWLWWAIYAMEKHVSFIAGRSSTIDDSVISTPVPSEVPPESNMDLEYLTLVIRHAKICSRISREIMSVQGRRWSANGLQKVVKDLDKQVRTLLDDLPPSLQIGTLTKLSSESQRASRHIYYALHLHFSIYGSLLAIHSHFSYPWLSASFLEDDQDVTSEAQIAISTKTVAEAARKILVALRTVTTNAATPTWLSFSYPIYAHLSLLIHVLRHPTLPTTSADLGLLDVCAGHFGYIDFMTSSEISVSLPRESANLAAKVVKAAKKSQNKDKTALLDHVPGGSSIEVQNKSSQGRGPDHTLPRSASTAMSQTGDITTDVDLGAWDRLPSFDLASANHGNLETFYF